jgi:hypothetical protein
MQPNWAFYQILNLRQVRIFIFATSFSFQILFFDQGLDGFLKYGKNGNVRAAADSGGHFTKFLGGEEGRGGDLGDHHMTTLLEILVLETFCLKFRALYIAYSIAYHAFIIEK